MIKKQKTLKLGENKWVMIRIKESLKNDLIREKVEYGFITFNDFIEKMLIKYKKGG